MKKIVELFGAKDNVQNDDVQALLGVSDATATRYLEELEQGAKIQQVGKTEHSVYYVQK